MVRGTFSAPPLGTLIGGLDMEAIRVTFDKTVATGIVRVYANMSETNTHEAKTAGVIGFGGMAANLRIYTK